MQAAVKPHLAGAAQTVFKHWMKTGLAASRVPMNKHEGDVGGGGLPGKKTRVETRKPGLQ